MSSVYILGPSVDGVIEPEPPATAPAPPGPARQTLVFDDPPTSPGGIANYKLSPVAEGETPIVNVYTFFSPQPSVPAPADRTADWFFKSGHPSGSSHSGKADANGKLVVTTPGVKPSLTPYHVQSILEFTS